MNKRRIRLRIADEPVSQRDVLMVALIGMLLGGTIFWFFAAMFWGFQLFKEAGSGADLLAAAGTWIIGLAAVGFTSDERRQNRRENRFAADKRRRDIRGRLRLMAAKAKLLHRPHVKMTEYFSKNPPAKRRIGGIKFGLYAGQEAVRIVEWNDEERFLLSEEGIVALTEVQLRVQRLHFILNKFYEKNDDARVRIEVRRVPLLRAVLSDIRSLKRAAEKLQQHIDDVRIDDHVC